MHNDQIAHILFEKYQVNQLANLYLVEPDKSQKSELPMEWICSFLQKIIQAGGQNSLLENEPDILLLQAPRNKKQYTKDDIEAIKSFITHKAMKLKQKFLIINSAHKLSETNANKLLKTFEEPPVPMSIFLLNETKQSLLSTIESRSIKLRLKTLSTSSDQHLEKLKSLDLEAFSQYIEKNDLSVASLVSLTLQDVLTLQKHSMDKVQHTIKSIEQDLEFNNSMRGVHQKLHYLLNHLK